MIEPPAEIQNDPEPHTAFNKRQRKLSRKCVNRFSTRPVWFSDFCPGV